MKKKLENEEAFPFYLPVLDNPAFSSSMSPVTNEELAVLADLRKIKEEARTIQSQLAGIHSEWKLWINDTEGSAVPREASALLQHLKELRAKWKERAQAYEEARRRRMIALGHENP